MPREMRDACLLTVGKLVWASRNEMLRSSVQLDTVVSSEFLKMAWKMFF